jgi:hypothetical protein
LFDLGQIVATPGVLSAFLLQKPHLISCVRRHAAGDWGNLHTQDKAVNDAAVKDGTRIMSAYQIDPKKPSLGYGDNTLWIITEADRSVTTLLLPDEY